tara:strand:- start:131 stop:370 length:240 start_codon:yes stop_codon:yes gene_type:complete
MKQLLMPIVMTLSSMPMFAFGYLIKVKKQVNLISGIDLDEINDLDRLLNWMGNVFCLVGVLGDDRDGFNPVSGDELAED